MHTGKLYLPGDKEITERQIKCLDKLYDFNMTRPTELEKREKMLKEMFAEEIVEGCYTELPFLSEAYKICAVHVFPGVSEWHITRMRISTAIAGLVLSFFKKF